MPISDNLYCSREVFWCILVRGYLFIVRETSFVICLFQNFCGRATAASATDPNRQFGWQCDDGHSPSEATSTATNTGSQRWRVHHSPQHDRYENGPAATDAARAQSSHCNFFWGGGHQSHQDHHDPYPSSTARAHPRIGNKWRKRQNFAKKVKVFLW